MQRINVNAAPIVFLDKLTKLSHLYPNRFSQLNETKPTRKSNRCKYIISIKGPYICNKHLTKQKKKKKKIASTFKLALKIKMLLLIKERSYF